MLTVIPRFTIPSLKFLGWSLAVLLFLSVAPLAAQPAGPGGGGDGGDSDDEGSDGMDGAFNAVQATSTIVVDKRNRSLRITTTPSNHRKIEKLLLQVTRDPLADPTNQVHEMSLINITPDQFRNLIRFHNPRINPNDPRRFFIGPDSGFQVLPREGVTSLIIPPAPSSTTVGGGGGGVGGGGGGGGGTGDGGGGGAGGGGAGGGGAGGGGAGPGAGGGP